MDAPDGLSVPWFRGLRIRADCPDCDEELWAAHKGGNRRDERYLHCVNGHTSVWSLGAPPQFIRVIVRRVKDPRPCDFPGCGRTRKSRYCQGHAKQRQRRGEAAMKPLRVHGAKA